jgi:very-short-patch-repair endonuclease
VSTVATDRGTDERLRRILRSQNAAVAHQQLVAAGFSRGAIRARVARRTLVPVFYGAYVAGDPALLSRARESAALLSLGRRAVLSHASAAAIWGILKPGDLKPGDLEPGDLEPGDLEPVHVTVTHNPRPRPGIKLHRVSKLHRADVRTQRNLALTSPARTLIDLAAEVTASELAAAFGEARARRLTADAALEAALARAPKNHPGAAIIRRLLRDDPGSTYTRSRAERAVRQLVRAAELPQPLVNRRLNGFTVDFLWPAHRLILEVDGHGTHDNRLAFERDRRRDQIHAAAGYTVIRATWWQLVNEPMAVLARIAQALALRAA